MLVHSTHCRLHVV